MSGLIAFAFWAFWTTRRIGTSWSATARPRAARASTARTSTAGTETATTTKGFGDGLRLFAINRAVFICVCTVDHALHELRQFLTRNLAVLVLVVAHDAIDHTGPTTGAAKATARSTARSTRATRSTRESTGTESAAATAETSTHRRPADLLLAKLAVTVLVQFFERGNGILDLAGRQFAVFVNV
jgi:hypothetical protein